MSKRGFLLGKSLSVKVSVYALLIVVVLIGWTFAGAQTSKTVFSIAMANNVHPGSYADVDITLDTNTANLNFGGFVFLITFDHDGLTLAGVNEGSLLQSCGWEYFTYAQGVLPSRPGSLRIVAVASWYGGPPNPSCYLAGMTGDVVNLQFYVHPDPALDCLLLPVEFFWAQCSDNSFSSVSGESTYISLDVVGPGFYPHYPAPETLMTTHGVPDSCYGGTPTAFRNITFFQGGVNIACTDTIDERGDVNLNGIGYEIADWVIFSNYFLHGMSAFTVNPQVQVNTTDINGDGRFLEFRDLTYLIRVILGEVVPAPSGLPVDTIPATFVQDFAAKEVRVLYPDSLAGGYFRFSGYVIPAFAVPLWWIGDYWQENGYTNILMQGNPQNPLLEGLWFTYTGDGILTGVATADWHDNVITSHIAYENATIGCGDANGDLAVDIADVVYLIESIFSGGPDPLDPSLGDVNCDNLFDVADIVYIVAHIFGNGPAPCAGCK